MYGDTCKDINNGVGSAGHDEQRSGRLSISEQTLDGNVAILEALRSLGSTNADRSSQAATCCSASFFVLRRQRRLFYSIATGDKNWEFHFTPEMKQ